MTDVFDTLDMSARHIGDHIVVTVAGDVDLHTAPTLRAYVRNLVQQGAQHLVLDLPGVDFVDSTGLSTFITLLLEVEKAGGSLRLAGVPDRLMRMVTVTGVSAVLPVHATVTDALAARTGTAADACTDR
ncbi:STAS domain-containing protein [Streptomyces sp. NPDC086783]|uniref:STAS domain-containing protein n=1 Tax=Streptomyces sp. NPDC086783 TaxID=3365758 RepID=UPI0037F6D117